MNNMEELRTLKNENGDLIVKFSGWINVDNAEAIEKNLFRIKDDNPGNQMVLDFERLEYISSSGLRVLLNLAQKAEKKIRIINIPSMIYEIFEETGFVKLFDVSRPIKNYSLDGLELIGRGANGEVYRMDRERIIKVFQKSVPLEEIERERKLAQEALLEGIPTAISYSVATAGDRYGIVFEMIDADTLSATLKNKPDEYDAYTSLYIQLLKKIHSTEGKAESFANIKDIYYRAIDYCRDHYTDQELSLLRALVESVPDTGTLIHGDYHPNNIMVQYGQLILIDMGDMTLGHPIFDFLATAATQVNLVKLNREFAEFHTRMPAELITRTWRRLIDNYFADKDENERKRIEDQICTFSKLKVALAPFFGRGAAPEIIQASIDDARQNFLPLIDGLIGKVDW